MLHNAAWETTDADRLYHRPRERGKPGNITTVAVARELACFPWAAAVV